MKHRTVLAIFCFLCFPALAQEQNKGMEEAERIERARIATERKEAEAAFQAQEKACYGKFSVNRCIDAARSQRRAALADLRRQEIALNDAERRRKASERLRLIEQSAATQSQRDEAQQGARATPVPTPEAQPRAAGNTSDGPAPEPSRQGKVFREAPRKAEAQLDREAARPQKGQESARHLQRHEARVAEAEKRKAAFAKRLAERKKPLARPLPVPP